MPRKATREAKPKPPSRKSTRNPAVHAKALLNDLRNPTVSAKALLNDFGRLVWAATACLAPNAKYYDRQGKLLKRRAAWEAKWRDPNYPNVASTKLPDGKRVSTLWVGLDGSFGRGPPLIFETMVFRSENSFGDELDRVRYSTEEEALEGHERLVKK
jgi:hypothetical protein